MLTKYIKVTKLSPLNKNNKEKLVNLAKKYMKTCKLIFNDECKVILNVPDWWTRGQILQGNSQDNLEDSREKIK